MPAIQALAKKHDKSSWDQPIQLPDCNVLAMDVGSLHTGWVAFELPTGGDLLEPRAWGKTSNRYLRDAMLDKAEADDGLAGMHLVVEMIRPRGQPVSYDTMFMLTELGRFVGYFEMLAGSAYHLVFREDVKRAITGKSNSNDPKVRQAIKELYGPERFDGGKQCERCKGSGSRGPANKRTTCPHCNGSGMSRQCGDLAGFVADAWQALAAAVAWQRQYQQEQKLIAHHTRS